MCRIIQTNGTLENDEFKIIHGFPIRVQKEALISQQFSVLIAANQNVRCHAHDNSVYELQQAYITINAHY